MGCLNNPQKTAYMNSLSFVDPSTIDLDSKYYQSAQQLYQDGNCPDAENAFADYLNKYPNGAYALSAHFYMGDCAYQDERYDEALPHLEAVVASPGNQFMESALYGLASILYDKEAWDGAYVRYAELEQIASFPNNLLTSKVGQMRCADKVGRLEDAAAAAAKPGWPSSAEGEKRDIGLEIKNVFDLMLYG